MRSMKMAVVGAVLMGFVGFSVAQVTNSVDLALLVAKKQGQEQALPEGYAKLLSLAMTNLMQKGDLDSYVVVEAEKKRLEAEKTVPMPAEAKDAFKAAAWACCKARVAMLRGYVAALDGLVKAETKAGRIDVAKDAKMEKDKAAFELADLESKIPVEQVVADSGKTNAVKTNVVKKTPSIVGVWVDGWDSSYVRKITQNGGRLLFECNGKLEGECMERNGGFSIKGQNKKAVRGLDRWEFISTLSDDGKTLSGTVTWANGKSAAWSWIRGN